MENEQWKWITKPHDFTGRYKISNHGRVLSLVRSPKIIKPRAGYKNYLYVGLCITENGQSTTKSLGIGRLVALHFVPNPDPDNLPYVDHIDHDKWNNHYENLQWIDVKNNVRRSQSYYYEVYHKDSPECVIHPGSRNEVCDIVKCSPQTVYLHVYGKIKGPTRDGWYIKGVPKTGKERWQDNIQN